MRCLPLLLVVDVAANFFSDFLIVSMEWLLLRGDVWLQRFLGFHCRTSIAWALYLLEA